MQKHVCTHFKSFSALHCGQKGI